MVIPIGRTAVQGWGGVLYLWGSGDATFFIVLNESKLDTGAEPNQAPAVSASGLICFSRTPRDP